MSARTRYILLAGSGLWCSTIIVGALFHVPAIYAFFSQICHQQQDRSWHIAGSTLPVCIRCASIYLGFFAGLLFRRPLNWKILEVAMIATLAEVILAVLLWDSPTLRAATGFALGAAAAPFVLRGVHELFYGAVRGTV